MVFVLKNMTAAPATSMHAGTSAISDLSNVTFIACHRGYKSSVPPMVNSAPLLSTHRQSSCPILNDTKSEQRRRCYRCTKGESGCRPEDVPQRSGNHASDEHGHATHKIEYAKSSASQFFRRACWRSLRRPRRDSPIAWRLNRASRSAWAVRSRGCISDQCSRALARTCRATS
jgi:hypothetical protein